MDKKTSELRTQRVLKHVHMSQETSLPTLVGMEFVRFVRDKRSIQACSRQYANLLHSLRGRDPNSKELALWINAEADFAWAVYISHDPCHDDGKDSVVDRNTVIAFHRCNGTFKVIGRELPRKLALKLARGVV